MPPQRHRRYARIVGITLAVALLTAISTSAATATPPPSGRLSGAPLAIAAATPPAASGRAPIRVGSLTLAPCSTSKLAWCATIPIPLDYADPTAPDLSLYFEWFPATAPATPATPAMPAGTILAIQGGPGYPTTADRDDYRGTFGDLLRTRNLLMVDLRGTGRSSLITCGAVQHWSADTGTEQSYINAVGTCGTHLDHTWQRPDGTYVAASDLFTTANAARDVDRLLGLLHTGKVDFYGDSYGTFFGQTLTARFGSDLRSVTLDAAYPVLDENPFYPDAIAAAQTAFNTACQRSVACHTAAPGSSWSRVGQLAARLRGGAITGSTTTPDGDAVTETVGVNELIQLINIAGYDNGVYHDLDPAIRALLDDNDTQPLLRLAAQEIDNSDSGAPADFSAGLYAATGCSDYAQPFPYTEAVTERTADYRAAVAALPASTFAPFTVHEWVTEPDEEFDACEKWPAPAHPEAPIATSPPLAAPNLPVLVLSGDLDSLTTPIEGEHVTADMGPSARWILVRNDTHVNAMEDPFGCASGIVQRFISAPGHLQRMDASCATHTPEVRVVGAYPPTLTAVTAASAGAGNTASLSTLRLAAVGAAVVGDAEWRWWYATGDTSAGLRGGSYSFRGTDDVVKIKFDDARWTDDTTVNGTATWDQTADTVTASVTVTGPGGTVAKIQVSYPEEVSHSIATITGAAGGTTIVATLPAP